MDSEKLSAFLSFLRESEAGYNAMLAALTDSDAATQDLLHFLELEDPSPEELVTVGERLGSVRRNRREQKDRSEIFGAVASWCEDNRAAVKSLERLLGELRKIENRHAGRFYTPRTDAWDGLREKQEVIAE